MCCLWTFLLAWVYFRLRELKFEVNLRSRVLLVLDLVFLQMCVWYLRCWDITY